MNHIQISIARVKAYMMLYKGTGELHYLCKVRQGLVEIRVMRANLEADRTIILRLVG